MQYAKYYMQYAICNMQYAIYNIRGEHDANRRLGFFDTVSSRSVFSKFQNVLLFPLFVVFTHHHMDG